MYQQSYVTAPYIYISFIIIFIKKKIIAYLFNAFHSVVFIE